MRVPLVALGLGLLMTACASRADNISASYTSPIMFTALDCRQIAFEAQRVGGRVGELTVQQNNKAAGDAVATGVALVIFWPAALLVSGDGATAAELGRLKGEMVALEQASISKRCSLEFRRPANS